MSLNLDSVSVPPEIRDSLKRLGGKFGFTRLASKGANGYTFFGTNLVSQQEIALKYYYWGGEKGYHAEPLHLTRLQSPNIIPILDAAEVGDEWAYFVTPFCSNGDLESLIAARTLGVHEAARLCAAVLDGLTYLHGERLLHRDIKPQNIFMGENLTPLIGDFGSVKALPQASSDVPGSGHSPLYQPPESIQSGRYSVAGDLYQAGMLLYQLVGGYLPYDEISWLNKNQKKKYESMADNIDRCVFATECLRKRISAGRVLVIGSIPPWISGPLRRVIRKAAHKDPSKRFQSASEFAAKLIAAMSKSPDWTFAYGCPTLQSAKGGTEFRVVNTATVSDYSVEKRRNAGWRRDNKLGNGVLADMICAVEAASGW